MDAHNIIKDGTGNYFKSLTGLERKFYKLLIVHLKKMQLGAGGVLMNTAGNRRAVLALEKGILKWLKKVGYNDVVNSFLVNFDDLAKYQKEIHQSVNGLQLSINYLDTFKKIATDNVTFSMLGQGLNVGFVKPLQGVLYDAVTTGKSLIDVINELDDIVRTNPGKSSGLLKRHNIQISRDALGQYDGTVQTAIKNKYGLDAYKYIVSIVKDSRPQCRRWVKMGIITDGQIDEELKWAKKNGTGFIKSTTAASFAKLRGGYSCRHTVLPIRQK